MARRQIRREERDVGGDVGLSEARPHLEPGQELRKEDLEKSGFKLIERNEEGAFLVVEAQEGVSSQGVSFLNESLSVTFAEVEASWQASFVPLWQSAMLINPAFLITTFKKVWLATKVPPPVVPTESSAMTNPAVRLRPRRAGRRYAGLTMRAR